ncbi:efflux RND transporter periplasmic adaptor subunit [Rhizobium sp. G187]|uniref:efflux RND transporter periplasmic adaptor subunit n=1 Tax=unclassified Rhizobium TaxID=2613769 RepID=UPI0006B94C9A|nr:efflux RND transporter periplasmic adaptor subunit [Rhizobium sp. AAP43]KPF46449.1 hemolysin secretion protein D [Rhizobium sp. AAP43]
MPGFHRNKTMLLAAAVALAATTALAQDAAKPVAEPRLPTIVVTPAKTRTIVDRILATGTIRPVEEVYVQPLVDGLQVKSLEADVGDTVAADAVMARLNDDTLLLQRSQLVANLAKAEAALAQYEAQVTEAEAGQNEAKRQFDRSTRLAEAGTVSTAQREQAESALASADARLITARQAIAVAQSDIKVVESQIADVDLRLARTEIKSPVSGTVSARSARIGAIGSGAGTPLFTIIRDGQIELVADVPEGAILRLKEGQKATITVAGSSTTLSGSIRLVSPVIDAETRLGSVHIAIDDDKAARAGMFGSASITISEEEAIALPLSAVTSEGNSSTVRLVDKDVVKVVTIEMGIQDGAYVQVTKGLEDGALVVAKAGVFVRDGDKINPVEDTGSVSN